MVCKNFEIVSFAFSNEECLDFKILSSIASVHFMEGYLSGSGHLYAEAIFLSVI